MRAVYNRAVDLHRAPYVPHLFRSVYTGTRADRRRALDAEDMKKVFARLLQSDAVTPAMRGAQELFILMFLLRGLPFVDLAYLRKSDLRGNVISYRRRKTGRPAVCDVDVGSDVSFTEVYESRGAVALFIPDSSQ